MRITTALKAAAVALAVLAVTAPTVAQEDPGSPPGLDRVLRGDPLIADLDFDGGSLEAFVKALRKAAGNSPVNIVYSPEAAGLPVAPITLQHVDAFTALRSFSQSMNITPMLSEDRRSIVLEVDRISGGGAPVYTIEVHELGGGRSSGPGSSPSAQLHTAVHSISNLTSGSDGMPADDVLAAVQLALEMDGKGEAKLSYHEETGLVFARVSQNQAHVIEMTLVNLDRSLKARKSRERQAPLEQVLNIVGADNAEQLVHQVQEANALREEVQEMRRHISQLETLLADLKSQLAEARRQ